MASDTKHKNNDLKRQPLPFLRRAGLEALLRNRVWPEIPAEIGGTQPTKDEKEKILGYGPEGY